jgi:hypothetical protein
MQIIDAHWLLAEGSSSQCPRDVVAWAPLGGARLRSYLRGLRSRYGRSVVGVGAVTIALADQSEADLARVLGGTACHVYGLAEQPVMRPEPDDGRGGPCGAD